MTLIRFCCAVANLAGRLQAWPRSRDPSQRSGLFYVGEIDCQGSVQSGISEGGRCLLRLSLRATHAGLPVTLCFRRALSVIAIAQARRVSLDKEPKAAKSSRKPQLCNDISRCQQGPVLALAAALAAYSSRTHLTQANLSGCAEDARR
jgi:hypothetical protein